MNANTLSSEFMLSFLPTYSHTCFFKSHNYTVWWFPRSPNKQKRKPKSLCIRKTIRCFKIWQTYFCCGDPFWIRKQPKVASMNIYIAQRKKKGLLIVWVSTDRCCVILFLRNHILYVSKDIQIEYLYIKICQIYIKTISVISHNTVASHLGRCHVRHLYIHSL